MPFPPRMPKGMILSVFAMTPAEAMQSALDTLAAPTDVTTLNASTTAHGLLPKLGGGTANEIDAYKAAHPPGRQIVLPDLKNPGKSIA